MKLEVLAIIIVLGIILTIIAFVVVMKHSKKPSVATKQAKKDGFDFNELIKMVSNPNLSSKELLEALQLFNAYFRIDDANLKQYFSFLEKCLKHKNVNKEVFQYFHNEIKDNNPLYKDALDALELKSMG